MNHPDPKKHKQISFIKSIIRIVGFCMLPVHIETGAALLVIAEFAGIWEETV